MKLKAIFKMLTLSILIEATTSCSNEPNPFLGLYQGTYVSEGNNEPRLEFDMQVNQVNDTTYDAKLAVHHYFKKNLLFTDLTCESKVQFSEDNDTMSLEFTLPADTVDVEWASKEPRSFDLKFVLNPETKNLELVNSSDENIFPDYFITLNRALNAKDSAKVYVERRYPKQIIYYNDEVLYGDIEKIDNTKGYISIRTYTKEGYKLSYSESYNTRFTYLPTKEDNGMTMIYCPQEKTKEWYDEKNVLRKAYLYGSNYFYYYDIYGRLAQVKVQGVTRSFSQKITLYYDKHGFVTKVDKKGDYASELIRTPQEFDDMGNVTKYKENSHPWEFERNLTYYK